MKTVVCPAPEAVSAAAERLLEGIERDPAAVLVCSAADDELLVLRALSAAAKERGVSLEELRVFAACEFDGLAPGDVRSARSRIAAALSGSGLREERLFAPSAADCEGYESALREAGGAALALLGLGYNARVAFNEPATPFAGACHVQKLTDKTRAEFAALFGAAEEVPEKGVTLGFRALCAARDIVVIALGGERSEAVFQTLYARDDSVVPAAFLQLPLNVEVYVDEAAGAKL